jgi:colanic acid biosynthesis glycosyl transferase WcaI
MQYFQPEPIFKGLPLARALLDLGHEVEVLTGFPNYPGGKIYSGYRLKLYQQEVIDGIKVTRLPLYPSHSRSGIRRIFNFLSFGFAAFLLGPWFVKRPDVIYVYNLVTLGPAWRILRLLYGSKVVVDVQDLWPESVSASGMMKSRIATQVLELSCRSQYKSANKLVVLSPGFKQNLTARGIDEKKIEVIYNWCDESSISVPEPNPEDAARFQFSHRFNIVFAGTMGVSQSLDCVLEAANAVERELPDVQFTFVGGGIEVPRLRNKASNLSNVQFLDPMPPSEIGTVLANADVLLVHLKDDPIFRITIPSKIQAYLFAGKPILCGVRGDASDLVQKSGSGVSFMPDDSDSLIKAVRKLRTMTSEELRIMGKTGRTFYESELSMAQGVHRIEKVLRECVEPALKPV